MPLSEHEQRLLEQMERALYAEDPKFASALREPVLRRGARKRLVLGILLTVAGIGLLVVGVAVKLAAVGVVGFVVMLAGAIVAFTGGSTVGSPEAGGGPGASDKAHRPAEQGTGFMDRMEDRWRQRREGDPE